MPGAGWKRKCEELNAMSKEIADKPYYQIKRDLVRMRARLCSRQEQATDKIKIAL